MHRLREGRVELPSQGGIRWRPDGHRLQGALQRGQLVVGGLQAMAGGGAQQGQGLARRSAGTLAVEPVEGHLNGHRPG